MKAALIIVMGVSGSGKSTLAINIASKLQLNFLEADDFHSEEAKQMMADGIPLTDDIRGPWITRICSKLAEHLDAGESCVLAYSGLREQHRETIKSVGFDNLLIYLEGSAELIHERMLQRKDHFMSPALLKSQFEAMEAPLQDDNTISLNVSLKPKAILNLAVSAAIERFPFLKTTQAAS